MRTFPIISITFLLMLTVLTIHAQTCMHTSLSNTFNFQTNIKRIKIGSYPDSCIVSVTVRNKITNKKIQTIRFSANSLFDSSFVNCNRVRSYLTGKNKNAETADNDYGDLIIADFNFDGREDFAVKRDEGPMAGASYNYYLQSADTTFKMDKFLSEVMVYFPTYFNGKKKTLTSVVIASYYHVSETTYKLDTLTNKWAKVGHRLIGDKKFLHAIDSIHY